VSRRYFKKERVYYSHCHQVLHAAFQISLLQSDLQRDASVAREHISLLPLVSGSIMARLVDDKVVVK
jgi:hypothetical protein